MNIGIISGYFNPVHSGHIEYIQRSKQSCDFLVAIINSDYQVSLKKSKPFMDEKHRANIILNIKGVDYTIISHDFDMSQCETLKYIRSLWPNETMSFFNSGDRTASTINFKEKDVCEKLEINFVLLHQPKIYSSSNLLNNV